MAAVVVASMLNDLSNLQRLITLGHKIDEVDPWGDTALHAAANAGRYTLVKFLIEKGADVNKTNKAGSTPLHKACIADKLSVVELLLRYGASPNIPNFAGLRPEDYTSNIQMRKMLLGSAAVTEDIVIPKSLHGVIIGKGGKRLRQLRSETGADIRLPPPASQQEEISISGREEVVQKAREMILQLVQQREATTEQEEPTEVIGHKYTRIAVDIPKEKHRLIIGVGGKTIKELTSKWEVRIKVPLTDSPDTKIIVSGSAQDVDEVAERIRRLTSEKAPGINYNSLLVPEKSLPPKNKSDSPASSPVPTTPPKRRQRRRKNQYQDRPTQE
jgi:rRNA processing protein Krr1/Pno1